MFGMGFFEICVILIVAVIFLGPEKLPKAIVDIVKFVRVIKKSLEDAKESLDKEINMNKIKEEALAYKASFEEGAKQIGHDLKLEELSLNNLDNILEDTPDNQSQKDSKINKDSNPTTPTPKESTPQPTPKDTKEQKETKITPSNNFGASLDFKSSTTQPTQETINKLPPKEAATPQNIISQNNTQKDREAL